MCMLACRLINEQAPETHGSVGFKHTSHVPFTVQLVSWRWSHSTNFASSTSEAVTCHAGNPCCCLPLSAGQHVWTLCRCLRLLAVAVTNPFNRLEIRRFRGETHWLCGANVEVRALYPGTPRALARLPSRDSLLVVCPDQLQLLSDGGRGSSIEASLPYGEHATCAAVWRPEQPGTLNTGEALRNLAAVFSVCCKDGCWGSTICFDQVFLRDSRFWVWELGQVSS